MLVCFFWINDNYMIYLNMIYVNGLTKVMDYIDDNG